MSSPPGRTILARAGPLVQDFLATRTSRLTSSRGTGRMTSSEQGQKTPMTTRDDDTGPALTSVPSHRNQGPTGLKPQLRRSEHRFSVKDWLEAEVHNNSVPPVTDGKYGDRKSRPNTASDGLPTTSDAGHTGLEGGRHSKSTRATSQSNLCPTKHGGSARSMSPLDSGDRGGQSRDGRDEEGCYSDALPNLAIGYVKGDPKARHDVGRLIKRYGV
jgi:hypothetical protein